ncbi:MAG: type VI secretion system baseplate subunit TssG [Ferrovibrionaceae bacterium]
MAGDDRVAQHDLRAALYAEPERFAFVQAVRLLEQLSANGAEVGSSTSMRNEPVRFTARNALSFPASEIDGLKPGEGMLPPTLIVAILGLAGIQGPLPRSITEMMLGRIKAGDRAMADFLDLFNHRLIALYYQAIKAHRPLLESSRPEMTRVGRALRAIAGLGRGDAAGDATLLRFAGILSEQRRPAEGLRRLVQGMLQVPVAVTEFVGEWRNIPPEQQTRLGASGSGAQRLGQGAVLGHRAYDQQGTVELVLGPLTLERYLDCLPGGPDFARLERLVPLYCGPALEVRLRLLLNQDSQPSVKLCCGTAGRLGRTTWLGNGPRRGNASSPSFLLNPLLKPSTRHVL